MSAPELRDCCVRHPRLGTLDQQPQHERNLPDYGGLKITVHRILIFRQQGASQAQDDPGKTGEGKPNSQEPRQESRLVDKEREGKQPEPPEHFADDKSATVKIQEKHRHSLALGFVEYG
jgi:hypothetical protein